MNLSVLWKPNDIPFESMLVFVLIHPDDFIAQVQGNTDRT